jgi:hypothetical protein
MALMLEAYRSPVSSDLKIALSMQIIQSMPCGCHANYFILHGIISDTQIDPAFIGLLARSERFELPTLRFEV